METQRMLAICQKTSHQVMAPQKSEIDDEVEATNCLCRLPDLSKNRKALKKTLFHHK